MFDTKAVISTTNKSDETKCDLCGRKMTFKNLQRHYKVIHNQTFRKQEKHKTGPRKKKDNKKDKDKKRGEVVRKKGKCIYVNREETKFQRRLVLLNYFKTFKTIHIFNTQVTKLIK